MVATTRQTPSVQSRAFETVLLSYLAKALPGRFPGCDGLTTQQMLQGYAELADQGLVPGRQQLQRWHPDFKPQLASFFRESTGFDASQTVN